MELRARTLRCKGCDSLVPPDDVKIYATILCCPTCFEVATRHEARLNADIQRIQVLIRDLIRVRLLEGRLQFSLRTDEVVSKTELLRAVVELVEMKDDHRAGAISGDSPNEQSRTAGSSK